eukprot:3538700-Prorocentrum_lima.AAC.1
MSSRKLHINIKWTLYDLPEDLHYRLHCCRRATNAAEYNYMRNPAPTRRGCVKGMISAPDVPCSMG